MWRPPLRGGQGFPACDSGDAGSFGAGNRGRIHRILDAFNVTINDTVLGCEARLNTPFNGRIAEVLQRRTIRLGLR